MVSYKDKIVTFLLFNTCYPQNLARNPARFFAKRPIDLCSPWLLVGKRKTF